MTPIGDEALKHYFQQLFKEQTIGAKLAQAFLGKSREIAQHLVDQGVAKSHEDVDTVLKYGFYHIYGPDLGRHP